jgi:hypothetical protein
MATTRTTSSGLTFNEALTVLFVGLKLCHVIDWSWWWVLAPQLALIPIMLVVEGLTTEEKR